MRLSVTTPRGSLVETDIDEVSAPGALGEFGILPGHVPFISALKPGVLVFRHQSQARVLAVSDGILEVARTEGGGDKVLVLVSDASHAEEIDRDASAKEAAAADQELSHWSKDLGGEYKALLNRRDWANARLDAAARLTPH
jgi:F-type H+-transporting ATPase subunit epsilon